MPSQAMNTKNLYLGNCYVDCYGFVDNQIQQSYFYLRPKFYDLIFKRFTENNLEKILLYFVK